MSESHLIARTWAVGKRFRCTLTVPRLEAGFPAVAECVWEPSLPNRLTHREERDYIRGRDDAIKSITRELGVRPAK